MSAAKHTPGPSCQMRADCVAPVTHIGSKGYVYCTECAVQRRASGYERCRKMRAWELALVRQRIPLPSYEPLPRAAIAKAKGGANG